MCGLAFRVQKSGHIGRGGDLDRCMAVHQNGSLEGLWTIAQQFQPIVRILDIGSLP